MAELTLRSAAETRYDAISLGEVMLRIDPGAVPMARARSARIWHGGGANRSDKLRYMFKIRLCPTEKQVCLWDFSDLPDDHLQQRPIFWIGNERASDHIHTILTEPEPWFEFDTSRLEYINRIKFWRYLLGDQTFDADYWLTRLENEFE